MAWVPLLTSGVAYSFNTDTAVGTIVLEDVGGETRINATSVVSTTGGLPVFTLLVGEDGGVTAPAPNVRLTFLAANVPVDGGFGGSVDFYAANLSGASSNELTPATGLDYGNTILNKVAPYNASNPPDGVGTYTGQEIDGWSPAEIIAIASQVMTGGEGGESYPRNSLAYRVCAGEGPGDLPETFSIRVEVLLEDPEVPCFWQDVAGALEDCTPAIELPESQFEGTPLPGSGGFRLFASSWTSEEENLLAQAIDVGDPVYVVAYYEEDGEEVTRTELDTPVTLVWSSSGGTPHFRATHDAWDAAGLPFEQEMLVDLSLFGGENFVVGTVYAEPGL